MKNVRLCIVYNESTHIFQSPSRNTLYIVCIHNVCSMIVHAFDVYLYNRHTLYGRSRVYFALVLVYLPEPVALVRLRVVDEPNFQSSIASRRVITTQSSGIAVVYQ